MVKARCEHRIHTNFTPQTNMPQKRGFVVADFVSHYDGRFIGRPKPTEIAIFEKRAKMTISVGFGLPMHASGLDGPRDPNPD